MKYRGIALALAALASLAARPASAQYTFTNLVSNASLTATSFSEARINNSGAVAFATNSTSALYLNAGGTNTLIAQNGAATALGSTYTALDATTFSLDNSGRVTFRSNLATGGGITTANNQALWRFNGGTTTALVQRGVTTLPGSTATFGAFGNYAANNNGDFVLVNTTNGARRVVKGSGGTLTNVAVQGQTAPGTGTGSTFESFAFPVLGDDGAVAFFGSALAVNAGLFSATSSGVISDVVLQGDPVPGVANSNFTAFPLRFARSSGGELLFNSLFINTTTSVQARGLFTTVGGNPTAVALPGQAAPGGAFFASATYQIGNFNASGVSVFRASDLTGAYTEAVFSLSGASLNRILGQGDSLFGGIVATVGTPSINDNGAIAVSYTLTNGSSGVLVANVGSAAVAPEPASGLLLLLGGVAAVAVRRRRAGR